MVGQGVVVKPLAGKARSLFGDSGVFADASLINDSGQREAMLQAGLQGEEDVVQTSQAAAGDQEGLPAALGGKVDGEQLWGEGHHQTAGGLHQNDVVAARQLFGGSSDSFRVHAASF